MNKNKKYLKKYHFRRYKKTNLHPFLVVLVRIDPCLENNILFSGFNLTRSPKMAVKKPRKYIKIKNPNPSDILDSYLCLDLVVDKPIYLFEEPLLNWKLSEKDKKIIERIVKNKIKTPRRS